MKKNLKESRDRDIRRTYLQRKLGVNYFARNSRKSRRENTALVRKVNKKILSLMEKGLSARSTKDRKIYLDLPSTMNLSSHYDDTMMYIHAIRALTLSPRSRKFYRLASVNFERLSDISSSAALLLTAELSRWDDSIRNNLRPQTSTWNPEILKRFHSLGFFDLFKNSPASNPETGGNSGVHFVRYVKGNHLKKDYRQLKEQLFEVIGSKINKWTFLHSGLDEAITNVCHHAYPDEFRERDKNKNWYLTGAYNERTRELKVVFCDQGIGIPTSLPASKIWEKVLTYLSVLPLAVRRQHSTLLKAAMNVSRTSTNEDDRGKGLPDMKEFIKQRGAGYLALLSGHGLYKMTVANQKEVHKSDTLSLPIEGTLIIWKVQL